MIEVKELTVRAGTFRLEKVGFCVPGKAYAILMGKTGSGKTTMLEALCGLRPVESGTIRLMGKDATRARPAERGIGYVPQDGALFPSLTVGEHLAFACRFHRWPKAAITRRIHELASLLDIHHLLERKPKGLSGGERQRTALGRALSFRPKILCLDEPISSLDEETRDQMKELLKTVSQQEEVTTLHVTHSSSEAESLGSMVFRIKNGRISRNAAKHAVS